MSENNQSTKLSGPKFIWAGLVVIILIAVGIWGVFNFTSSADSANRVEVENVTVLDPAPKIGHPAPDFRLRTLAGQEIALSDFRGQLVVINFWATWCDPCRVEMPHFQEAYTAYQNEVVVLGVNLTEQGEVARLYNAFGQPASVFVDADGVVHTVFYGPVNRAFIDARISELLES